MDINKILLGIKIIKFVRKFKIGRKLIKFLFNKYNIQLEESLEIKSIKSKNPDFYLKGYLKISPDEQINSINKNKLDLAIQIAEGIIARNKTNSKKKINSKEYLINLLEFKSSETEELKKILDFILSDEIIMIVRSYLSIEPLLTELKILFSPIENRSSKLTGSQLFHLDFDDDKIIKIFINLNDIDSETGPLEIIDKPSTNQILSKNKNFYSKHSDNFDLTNNSQDIKLVGSKRTINFVDTCSCLHRGSRNNKKERFVLYANFSSRSSFRHTPIFAKSKRLDVIKHHSPLFELEKLVPESKKIFLKCN